MFKKNFDNKYIIEWIELVILDQGYISKSDILGEFSDFEQQDADDIFIKLGNRLFLYGCFTPYEISGDMIKSTFNNTDIHSITYLAYKFSLILSTFGNNIPRYTQKTGKIFEKLSNEAFKEYLGGDSIVFGFPDGSTSGISSKIDEIAKHICEKRGNQNPLHTAKDCKLDIITFKKIDNRENKIVILVQSAAGKDWATKLSELSTLKWQYYINFSMCPLRGFSAPVFIDDYKIFYDKCLDAGLLFDRPRIMKFISPLSAFNDSQLKNDITEWIDDIGIPNYTE